MREHERNAAALTHVALVFIEIMAHFGGGSVAVIRKSFYHNGNSRRTVALVDNLLIVCTVSVAGGFFDDTVNVVVGNVVCLCFGDDILKLGV